MKARGREVQWQLHAFSGVWNLVHHLIIEHLSLEEAFECSKMGNRISVWWSISEVMLERSMVGRGKWGVGWFGGGSGPRCRGICKTCFILDRGCWAEEHIGGANWQNLAFFSSKTFSQ